MSYRGRSYHRAGDTSPLPEEEIGLLYRKIDPSFELHLTVGRV